MSLYTSVKRRFGTIANKFSLLALFIYLVTAVILHKNKELFYSPQFIIAFDAMGYYSYLQWLFISEERDVKVIAQEFNPHYTVKTYNTAGEEVFVNKYSTGLAMLQVPFFLIGHVVAHVRDFPQDGLSAPYLWWTTFGALLYAFLALLILRRFLLRYYNDGVVGFVLLGIIFATNWWYYIFHHPFMSHNYSCFLFILTLYCSQRWYETGAWKHYIPLAIGVGLIAAVRVPNLVYGVVLAFGGVYNLESLQKRLSFLGAHWLQMVVGAVIVVGFFVPQLWYWHETTGHWWFNTYLANDEHFYWAEPMVGEVLIGYRKGWFIYTPIVMLMLFGLFFLRRQYPQWLPSIIIYLVINIYVVSCWGWWWYGGSFGMRALTESMIPLALPFAALLHWAKDRAWSRAFFFGAIFFFTTLNQLQTHQYAIMVIHYQSMTRKAYWHSFGKFPPYSKEFRAKNDSLFYHPNMHLESHREQRVSTIW